MYEGLDNNTSFDWVCQFNTCYGRLDDKRQRLNEIQRNMQCALNTNLTKLSSV